MKRETKEHRDMIRKLNKEKKIRKTSENFKVKKLKKKWDSEFLDLFLLTSRREISSHTCRRVKSTYKGY